MLCKTAASSRSATPPRVSLRTSKGYISMPDFCRARLGLGALTLALTTIVALTVAPSSKAAAGTAAVVAQTTASPEAQTTSAPIPVSSTLQLPVTPHLGRLNAGQPTPFPLNTLGPLSVGTSLPFPAYGTPVPGVNKGTPAPDVPTQIGLQQAELIGFARSPQLAIARADVGVEAAAVRLERAGLLPNFSGSAGYTYAHEQAGGTESAALLASGLGSGAGARTTSNNATLGLSLTQLIFDGGRIAAPVEAAERSETNAADTYRRDLQTVAFDVATAYYNYLAAERLTQVDLEIVRE